MFTEDDLRGRLPIGGLGVPLHFLASVGSTNDLALDLAHAGASHGTLVVAESQTRGRGRGGRQWKTPAGTGLAASIVLRPSQALARGAWAIGVAGALAVAEAAEMEGAMPAIKWPNDVLLGGKKVAGLLVDAMWQGEQLQTAVLGMGVNVLEGSAPPDDEVDFPATSMQEAIGRYVDRGALLLAMLESLSRWLPRVGGAELRQAWWRRLAYRDEWVSVVEDGHEVRGRLTGINAGGGIELSSAGGISVTVGAGAGRLRPIDKPLE